ncbi:MAG: hypothetical protein PVF95_03160 [bacterium]|jgi:hypothetical protein
MAFRNRALQAVAAAAFVVLLAAQAWAGPAPAVDQNKLFWQLPPGAYNMHFNDLNGNLVHDPGEPILAGGDSVHNVIRADLSCWIASTSNLLVYSGFANPYMNWLVNGIPPDPNVSVWGLTYWAAGPGARTVDDGGWQDWGLSHAGVVFLVPIRTIPEFGGNWFDGMGNAINPIQWCKARLDTECVPVGLTCWFQAADGSTPVPPYEEAPGPYDLSNAFGYHAITLWDIDTANLLLTITDSDDIGILGGPPAGVGPRTVPYNYNGIKWVITPLYPGINAEINYAVAIAGGGPSATEASTWGRIKGMYR